MGESLLGQQVGGVCLDLFRGSAIYSTSNQLGVEQGGVEGEGVASERRK